MALVGSAAAVVVVRRARRVPARCVSRRSVRRCVGRPVVVIGNVTVGGTGKTPFTIWLATQLQARGVRVGIVLRGYGVAAHWPRDVSSDSAPEEVGDEAVLLASRTGADRRRRSRPWQRRGVHRARRRDRSVGRRIAALSPRARSRDRRDRRPPRRRQSPAAAGGPLREPVSGPRRPTCASCRGATGRRGR